MMVLAGPPDCTEPAIVSAEICAPFPLASFMLPLAKSLLVHKPSRPLQHQPWQLKNKHILLWVGLFLCPCLWLTFSSRHSPASALQEVGRAWTQTQSRCSQCKCCFSPSGLIVFALHPILGSPSLFSSYFVLESSVQVSFTLGMVIPISDPGFSKVRCDFLTPYLMCKPDLSSKTSSPLPLTIFSFIHPKMS